MLASLLRSIDLPVWQRDYLSCLGYPTTPSCVHHASRFNVIAIRCSSYADLHISDHKVRQTFWAVLTKGYTRAVFYHGASDTP